MSLEASLSVVRGLCLISMTHCDVLLLLFTILNKILHSKTLKSRIICYFLFYIVILFWFSTIFLIISQSCHTLFISHFMLKRRVWHYQGSGVALNLRWILQSDLFSNFQERNTCYNHWSYKAIYGNFSFLNNIQICTYPSKHWQFHPVPMNLRDLLSISSTKSLEMFLFILLFINRISK